MSKKAGAALLLAAALLFLIVNRGAYRGWFSDDDLDNLAWTRHAETSKFVSGLVTPLYDRENFRPVGHGIYKLMGSAAGLDFPKYVALLHALHLVNVWLVWLLARRLGAEPLAATLGTALFAFHMGAFGALWKPMYIFDVTCALFSLLAMHAFARGWTLAAFASFWLAYKSKELAVMLPAVLFLLDRAKWKQLIPFFAVSASFGLQAVAGRRPADHAYALHFTLAGVWTTASFYAIQLAVALIAVVAAVRKPAARFGFAAMLLFLIPLLFFPGRLFGAYTYLPAAGLAISAAFLEARILAITMPLWIPWNLSLLRQQRNDELRQAAERRAYFDALPPVTAAVYDGLPENFGFWGTRGALVLKTGQAVTIRETRDAQVRELLDQPGCAVLTWNGTRLIVVTRGGDIPFIAMDPSSPLWQLGDGWYPREGGFRWAQPVADARLAPWPAARRFELTVNIGPDMIREAGPVPITVTLDEKPLGAAEFTRPGHQTVSWPVSAPGTRVVFHSREYHPANGDPRRLGVPIVSFGFKE